MGKSSDDRIIGAIVAAFAASPVVDVTGVRVTSHDGRVRLLGAVSSLAERDAAMRIARATEGVLDVESNLVISPSKAMSDLEMQNQANARLADAGLANIGARVEAGTIFLLGSVPNAAIRDSAASVVAEVPGARDVFSQIDIAPGHPVDDAGLASSVAEAISDDERIVVISDLQIAADNGEVAIDGTVTDAAQIPLVEDVASHVLGVSRVDNRLRFEPEIRGSAA